MEIVALVVVFHKAMPCIMDNVTLSSCSFRRSWVILKAGLPRSVGLKWPKFEFRRVTSAIGDFPANGSNGRSQ